MEAKKKPTGEKQIFAFLWSSRPHKSFVSGAHLGNNGYAWMFAHCLSKNKYPLFRLLGKNIVFLTKEEHEKWDHGSRDKLKGPEWAKLFALEAELKEEYKKLTNQK